MPKDANKYIPAADLMKRNEANVRRMEIREKLVRGGAKKKSRMVELEIGDGDTIQLEARALNSGAVWRIQNRGFEDGPDGKRVLDREKFYPLVVAEAYFIPGTNERVWPEGEELEVGLLSVDQVNELAEIALELAGWSDKTDEAMEGNSEQVASDGSSSNSPTT